MSSRLLWLAAALTLLSCVAEKPVDPPILIHTSTTVQAPMLFAPCPMSHQNFPTKRERKA